jgi:hypothetical protein
MFYSHMVGGELAFWVGFTPQPQQDLIARPRHSLGNTHLGHPIHQPESP